MPNGLHFSSKFGAVMETDEQPGWPLKKMS
jgi:hypothetical protein